MKASLICAIVLGLILCLAAFSMGRETVRGLREGEIMSNGRRSSRLVSKEEEPKYFWMIIAFHSLCMTGLVAASVSMVWAAARSKPTNR
ncbi:MAG TPA: hypothetical protein VGE29_00605 [Prosthecobacter sp.]